MLTRAAREEQEHRDRTVTMTTTLTGTGICTVSPPEPVGDRGGRVLGFVVRRVVSGLLVLLVTSVSIFTLFFYGPSDPALAYCPEMHCSPDRLERVRHSLHLDDPVEQQYADYMKGIFVGRDFQAGAITIKCSAPCLGVSFKLRVDVASLLWSRFPATLSIALGGAALFLAFGVGLGVLAARSRGTPVDKLIVGGALVVNAMPFYLLALLAWLLLISQWGLFPESGYHSPFHDGPLAWVKGLLLAWLVLGVTFATDYARFSRGSMVEALNEDFVRTARAKGLSERRTVLRHALRAALVPVVTIFGLDLAELLGGTVFLERIFDIQGIGITALDALGTKDLPIISATILIAAFLIVVANVLVDVVYSLLDPRVRLY
jgi:peptide/nickel transport system permease protein